MSAAVSSVPIAEGSLLRPILVGGALAGTFNIISAVTTFGPGVPRAIAGGLLGRGAFQGGADMDSRIRAALLHRILGSGHLLPLQPQARIPERPLAGVRSFLWDCCVSCNESRRAAALRTALHGAVPVPQPSSGVAGAYAHHWPADFVEFEQAGPTVGVAGLPHSKASVRARRSAAVTFVM